jgi:hypothetical protein
MTTQTPTRARPRGESATDWTLAELGRSVTHLVGTLTSLTEALGELGRTVAEHGARLRTLERFAYTAGGAGVSLAVAAFASGHVHLS